ncbi:dormancy-associated protein 2-like [Lactuca sativa]|uniref:Glycine rich protein n=1 Tax=Lactuca sativa TaxID=4236 RepID=A0A9R1UWF8_LACSA|nr:dormancy-associated protein 2-like [Lactuca sativa]KAJ0194758.1 hypothetical protein LSAT_V11C700379640 [Lactuca sativa]
MSSKTFLLLALVLATILFISSEMAAAKNLEPNNHSEVEDAKYGGDDRGYNNGGGGYNNGGGGYNNGGGGYNNGGGRYNNGGGRYNNGGGRYNGGRGGGYCRYGCCGGGRYYNGGCRCCSTYAEATAYKQAHEAQTHN